MEHWLGVELGAGVADGAEAERDNGVGCKNTEPKGSALVTVAGTAGGIIVCEAELMGGGVDDKPMRSLLEGKPLPPALLGSAGEVPIKSNPLIEADGIWLWTLLGGTGLLEALENASKPVEAL